MSAPEPPPPSSPGSSPASSLGSSPGPSSPPPPAAALRGHTTRIQRMTLLGALVVAGAAGLHLFASVLLPFVAAAGIAYFLHPPAARLTRLGVPRGLAALVMVAGLLAVALLGALLLYPLLLAQIAILISRVPAYASGIRDAATDLVSWLQDRLGAEFVDAKLRDLVAGQAGTMLSVMTAAVTRVIGTSFAVFNVLTLLVVTPVVAFYLLRDWPELLARLDGWLPRRYAGVIRSQAHEVDRILSAWLRGQAMCCVILALYYALGLSLAGLDLALIVGVTAGMISFIPFVGSILGCVTSIGLAMAQFLSWGVVRGGGAVFLGGQGLENYVIYPRFLGDRVELHAVWVLFALFAGGAAFGFVGVLLAVPVAAAIGVVCRYWLRRYLRSPLYLETSGPPALPPLPSPPGLPPDGGDAP